MKAILYFKSGFTRLNRRIFLSPHPILRCIVIGFILLYLAFPLSIMALQQNNGPSVLSTDTPEQTMIKIGEVHVDVCNIRSQSSTESDIVGKLGKGEMVRIYDEKGEWYQITASDNRSGWVYKTLILERDYDLKSDMNALEKDTRYMAVVKVPVGRIRLQPSTDAPIKFRLFEGDTVAVVDEDDLWKQIKLADGRTGWAYDTLLEKKASSVEAPEDVPATPSADTVTVKVTVGRVRSAPSMDADILFRIFKGKTMPVVAQQDPWYKIQAESGKTGWAHESLFHPLNQSPPMLPTVLQEIRGIYAQKINQEEEKIVFILNGYFTPRTYVVAGDHPKVICEFADTVLDPTVKSSIDVDGELIQKVDITADGNGKSVVKVVLDLVPDHDYQVQPVFYKNDNLYALVVRLK